MKIKNILTNTFVIIGALNTILSIILIIWSLINNNHLPFMFSLNFLSFGVFSILYGISNEKNNYIDNIKALQWINVNDELPEIDEDVLWYYDSGIVVQCAIDKDWLLDFLKEFLAGKEETGKITHWTYIVPPDNTIYVSEKDYLKVLSSIYSDSVDNTSIKNLFRKFKGNKI